MAPRKKLDLRRVHKGEYVAPKNPRIIVAAKAQYLAICGRGTPGGDLFRTQAATLFRMAYALKRAKKRLGKDFKVCPLEGLWWRPEPQGEDPTGDWIWKLLIRLPTFVRRRDLSVTVAQLARGRSAPPAEVKLEQLREGRCVQALHVGPCSTECQTIERMRRAAQVVGLVVHGRHHEIYVSDPRRVSPERMRTILRLPVRAAR